jgi:hypothetical protein
MMVTRLLQEMYERAAELPEGEQDRLASVLLNEIEEDDDFDRLMAEHPEALDHLEERAVAALRAGDLGLKQFRADWQNLALAQLGMAYGDDEPDYETAELKPFR